MAYNKLGTPTFYIDYFQHWNTMGMIDEVAQTKNISITDFDENSNDNPINLIGLNPSNNIWFDMNSVGGYQDDSTFSVNFNKYIHRDYLQQIDYVGYLGHTFSNDGLMDEYRNDGDIVHAIRGKNQGDVYIDLNGDEKDINRKGKFEVGDTIINSNKMEDNIYVNLPFNGFSLHKVSYNEDNKYFFYNDDNILEQTEDPNYPGAISSLDLIDALLMESKFRVESEEQPFEAMMGLGCLTIGHTYTMPHSPDLNVSFEVEYDGYDQTQTLGGSTLTKVNYSGSPQWAFGTNPWEIYPSSDTFIPPYERTFNSDMRRKGRRVWNLKFSYLKKEDLFSSNHSTNRYYNELGVYSEGESHNELVSNSDLNIQDINNNNVFDLMDLIYAVNQGWSGFAFNYNMLTDDSFESKVLNFIANGERFIFQPNSNSNQPSDFAICILDQDSLKASQVANGVYNISLKIREVW